MHIEYCSAEDRGLWSVPSIEEQNLSLYIIHGEVRLSNPLKHFSVKGKRFGIGDGVCVVMRVLFDACVIDVYPLDRP